MGRLRDIAGTQLRVGIVPFVVAALLLMLSASEGRAADKLKIGFIATLSSPAATAGPDMLDGFRLGIADSGGTLGGRDIDLVVGDDELKPDIGVQLARKMLDEDRVQLIAGIIPSSVLLAVARTVLPRKTFLIGLNAGPSQLAGAECNPYFFSVSYENDTAAEAMAMELQQRGVKSVYLIATNYAAGRDIMAGFKRNFAGSIAGESYNPMSQFDFAADLAELRAASPEATFFFEQSGAPAINFVKQYAEAGLKAKVPLYGVTFVLDETSLPGMGDAALGIQSTAYWSDDLDIKASRDFVAHFTAAYHRKPSIFAATSYDGARLIDSALRAVDGHIERTDAFRHALEAADLASVRGRFRFNTNHFPIQNFYLSEVARDEAGALTNVYKKTIVEDLADSYVGACHMK